MPVRSPTLNASVVHDPMNQDIAKNLEPSRPEKEETNENVSKEKLANMKLMMKTFVTGSLREKEQVNYFNSLYLNYYHCKLGNQFYYSFVCYVL